MKIYITGIAGFLGSHLAKKLKDQGHDVSGNDSMIQGDIENLPKNINFHKVDCCNYSEMVKNLKGYDQQRIYAYLAERYLSFWFKKYTKVKTCPWVFYNVKAK